jgi:hypothetical protein
MEASHNHAVWWPGVAKTYGTSNAKVVVLGDIELDV